MGLRGPQPTPTPILQARGSWRAKGRADEVQFERGKPSCPAFLGKEARAEWKRQVKALDAAGILALADRAMLAVYCEAWGEFAEASARVAEIGLLTKDSAGRVAVNPLMKVRNRAAERVMQIAAQFGFSASARTRLKDYGYGKEEPAVQARKRG
jgi:P27 family predicted phage terminase small subunit